MTRLVALLAIAGAALAACGPAGERPAGILVVTTVSPITSLVADVAGDAATVEGVVPEGRNSHEFEPKPSDAALFADADVVFVNGLNLELPTIELARANVRDGVEIVALGERTIRPEEYIFDFSFPKEDGDPNPHVWTNPPYAARFVEIIRDTLVSLDPGNAAAYRANAAELSRRLGLLTDAVRAATETVPKSNRVLLTYHDSFPYFARAFGWTVIGAVQPSDFAEPTAREIAGLIEQIRERKVPAIFGSEVFPSPVLRQIAKETGARYVDDLRDDDLPGDPGDPEHSYLGLMVFDFATMIEALGGDAEALSSVPTAPLHDGRGAVFRP